MSSRFTATYDTTDEIDFIKNIGSYRVVGKKKYSKVQLLEKYKNACEKRVHWGKIDKDIAFTTIAKEIEAWK